MTQHLIRAIALASLGCALLPLTAQAQASLAETQVNALEGLFGKQVGYRRAQAKGLCASGYFQGNVVGRSLSTASVFSGDKVPVIARFSVGGGNPKANDKGRGARGMALQFTLPKGEVWQMANISAPMYFVKDPADFPTFLQVRTPDPATGKPDAAKLKAFNDAHPETLLQAAYLAKAPLPASFGAGQFWGVNAFEFINAKKESQYVRWQFVPRDGVQGMSDEQIKAQPDNFLADELRQRVATAPVIFDFKLQLAQASDTLTDPTKVWPDDRVIVPAGVLVIDKVEAGMGGACDAMTFNPLTTPKGIKPSADPVLQARAAAYGVSLGRRLSEAAQAK